MNCKYCGEPMQEYDTKCSSCGSEFSREETWMNNLDARSVKKTKKFQIKTVLLFAIVLVIMIGVPILIGVLLKR